MGQSPAPGVVVISRDPPAGLAQRLRTFADAGVPVTVVDNGSAIIDWMSEISRLGAITLIHNTENRGIAAAMNQGLDALIEAGCSHALLLDHDSAVTKECFQRMLNALRILPDNAVGIVPCLKHPQPDMRCRWPQVVADSRWRFRFVYAESLRQPTPVDVAISSGMLLDLAKLDRIGTFRPELFIDLVDTELCLRARRHGLRLYAVPGAWMSHSIGTPVKRGSGKLPMFPTFHPPLRHYYLARNRIHLYREYAAEFPFWAIYETLGALKLMVKVILFEPGRVKKLQAMLRGTLDGLRGRFGPASFANLDGK